MGDVKNKRINIYIDQSSAEAALIALQVKADKLTAAIDAGRIGGKNMVSEIKKLKETQSAIADVQNQISSGLRPSMAQVETQVNKLRNELKRMSEDAPGYAAKFETFSKASLELNRMREAVNGVAKAEKSWFAEAKTVAFGVVIGNTVQSAIQAISGYVGGMVSGNAKLSDSLSDIEKSANLTTSQVASLNKELGSIDTRTKTADLREIAVGLGQIGEAANKANVQAIDKIVVALGDEFGGGAKEITTNLSVLRNNLQDIKSGDYATDVTHIGNSLNVLGAEGLASAPVVTDIANRLAGIAGTYKLTSGQILGLAATFQELGIESERGSTAVTKMFQKIGAEPEKFAKVAGMGTKEFKNLVNTDMLGAFDAVAAGAKKAGGNNIVFSNILKQLDADGSGAGEVISKLGTQHELLAGKVVLASNALKSDSSITDEFNKKNNNLAANLEKLNKNISGWFSSSTLSNFFNGVVTGMADLTKHTQSATESFNDQVGSLVKLKTNIEPLLPRYDELKNKTKLTIPEQAEMKSIIEQVTAVMPGAVTAFDKYGNAVGISTERVKEFINTEKARLKVTNSSAIEENKKALERVQLEIKNRQKIMDEIAKTGTFSLYETHSNGEGIQTQNIRKATQSEIAEAQVKYKDLAEKKKGYDAEIARLNGDALQKALDDKAKADAEMKKKQDDLKKNDPNAVNPFGAEKSEEEKKRESLLERLKNFKFEVEQIGKDGDEKEIDRIKKKYNELMVEATQHGVSLVGLEKEKNRAIAYLIEKDRLEQKAKQEKEFKDNATADYENQLKVSADFFEKKKQEQAQLYADGLIDKKQYEVNIATIDVEAKKTDIQTAQDYSANVKKAAEDVLAFKKKLTQEEIIEAIRKREKLVENEKLLYELQNKAALIKLENKVSNSPSGSAVNFNAQKQLKVEQERQALAAIERQEQEYKEKGIAFTNEFEIQKQAIRDKFKREDVQAEINYYTGKINTVLNYVQQALGVIDQFNQSVNAKEKAALDKELKRNDEKRKGIDHQLKSRVISEIESKKQLTALDQDDQRRKDALEAKQRERNKFVALGQATINGALAITSILAAPTIDPTGVLKAIQIAAAIATTAAQIAVISTTKYGKGGKLTGDSHANGGMPVINRKTGMIEAEMEGGEYILSKKTVENNQTLADMLLHSSMNEGGKAISTAQWQTRQYVPVDYAGITAELSKPKFASGGVFQDTSTAAAFSQQLSPQHVEALDQNRQLLEAVLHHLKNPIAPNVAIDYSLKKIDDANALRSRILLEAGA